MQGTKHLIQCRCVLPQYRHMTNPIFHQIVVFSTVDDHDNVVPKVIECPNCGCLHKVTEIGKSTVVAGREDLTSGITKDDLRVNLPENITRILEQYNCDLPTWEEVQFILENGLWGREILLKQEELDGTVQGKVLRIVGPGQLKIESFTREEWLREEA